MRAGGDRAGRGSGRRPAALLALAALLSIGALAPAADAKKKKKKPKGSTKVVTVVASAGIAPGAQAAPTANCPAKAHATGGGWSITAPYNPNGTDSLVNDTGTRTTHTQGIPNGIKGWTSGAAAFNAPANGSTFSTVLRCEGNSLGRTIQGAIGTSTVPVGQSNTIDMTCPPKTHVLTGGFSFSPPGDLANPAGLRGIVTESRRLDFNTWRVFVINPVGAPTPLTVSTRYVCELNQKGVAVTEASAVASIASNNRTTVTPACTGKTHTVGGGFAMSPSVGPAVGIDQMQPLGAKSWQVGLYEYPGFNLPAGSTVTGYSYCKKNAAPKKKKKKKKKRKKK